jgi:hypothetical protein
VRRTLYNDDEECSAPVELAEVQDNLFLQRNGGARYVIRFRSSMIHSIFLA